MEPAAPAPEAPSWYAQHYGPSFSTLLNGLLTAYVGQPLTLVLASGHTCTGVCAALAPGEAVTLAAYAISPAAAPLDARVSATPGHLRIPLPCLHAVRLPQGACVPRALAEAARAHQPRAARAARGRAGAPLPPRLAAAAADASGGAGAAPAAEAAGAVIGLSWALHGWSAAGASLTL